MKILTGLLTVILCWTFCNTHALPSAIGASPGLGVGLGIGIGGFSHSQIYQNVVLQAAAAKITTPDLPEDLQLKVADVLSNAEVGFSACDSLAVMPGAVWQQKRCSIFQLRTVLLQLSAIEKEAAARNATATGVASPNENVKL